MAGLTMAADYQMQIDSLAKRVDTVAGEVAHLKRAVGRLTDLAVTMRHRVSVLAAELVRESS